MCRLTAAPISIGPPLPLRPNHRHRRLSKVASHAETLTFTPPVADIDARRTKALIAGGVGLALCAAAFVVDRDNLFRSWVISFWLFLGISTGSLAMMMIQHLSGGQWGIFRRVFEASSRVLPVCLVLGL